MSKSDFSGEEFDYAPGSIHGLRSWRMDSFGRLTGVTHKEVWTPGENVATCKAVKRVQCPSVSAKKIRKWEEDRYAIRLYREGAPKIDPRSILMPCGKDLTCAAGYHSVPSGHSFDPRCECGFWAYFEDGFSAHGDVVGVVESYGKTTIGTKGFRAERARIVAFQTKSLSLTKTTRLAELYPDAAHYDTLAALVRAFPSLMNKEWGPMDKDFWTKASPQDDNDYMNLNKYLQNAYRNLTIPRSWSGL